MMDIKDFIKLTIAKSAGVLMAVAAAVCYTTENILLFKERKTAHVFLILSFSSVGAIAPSLLLAAKRRQNFIGTGGQVKVVLQIIFCGFLGASQHILFSISLFLIGPGNATLLFYSQPVFVLLLSGIFLKGTFKLTDILFVGLAVTAVVLVVSQPIQEFFQNHMSENDLHTLLGFIVALCGAAFASGQLVVARKLVDVGISNPVVIFAYFSQYFLSTIVLCTIFQAWEIPSNVGSVICMVASGVALFSAISLTYISLWYAKPTAVSVALSCEVFMTYFGEHIFFESDIHYTIYIACLLSIASCAGMSYTHQLDAEEEEEEEKSILKEANHQ